MRTTLDIADDVLQAAKELADRQGTTAGRVLSELARKALQAEPRHGSRRNGVPVFAPTGEIVTLEHVQRIADNEGV